MTGEIFDIKRFAVHDGPGIRCTAFLKGCPLACIWCHNPEGKRPGPEICCQPQACIGCGACISICPSSAIRSGEKGVVIDRERCVRCGKCAAACPADALSAKGYALSPEELVAEFEKDLVFFKTSGGGITLSGGDPLFQPTFAYAVLELAKAKGLHTAVETCLHAPAEAVEALLEVVDLWLCDIKIFDNGEHKRLTGRSNKLILSNYELLVHRERSLITRIPVIPGCTDSAENWTAIGRYAASVNPTGTVELMFYNPLGQSKYPSFGMDYRLSGSGPYTAEQQDAFREMVAATGVAAVK